MIQPSVGIVPLLSIGISGYAYFMTLNTMIYVVVRKVNTPRTGMRTQSIKLGDFDYSRFAYESIHYPLLLHIYTFLQLQQDTHYLFSSKQQLSLHFEQLIAVQIQQLALQAWHPPFDTQQPDEQLAHPTQSKHWTQFYPHQMHAPFFTQYPAMQLVHKTGSLQDTHKNAHLKQVELSRQKELKHLLHVTLLEQTQQAQLQGQHIPF